MAKNLSNEMVAAKLVSLYFREIARLGLKRSLDLDEVINAYYYVLTRLGEKEKHVKKMLDKVKLEEKRIVEQSAKEIIGEEQTETSQKTEQS